MREVHDSRGQFKKRAIALHKRNNKGGKKITL